MTFKRDGDDTNWLNQLQKRRVSELLSFDIPDEEALLTKNGRFACLVCSHKPVFDTVNVLTIHRSGKKHKQNNERFLKKKDDLSALKLARCHEEYTKYGKIVTKQLENEVTCETFVKSLGAAPYDSRVKKKKPTARKHRIMLGDEDEVGDILQGEQYRGVIVSERTSEPDSYEGYRNSTCTSSHQATSQNCSEKRPECYNSDKLGENSETHKVLPHKPNQNKKFAKSPSVDIEAQTIADYRKQQAYEERIGILTVRPYVSKRSTTSSSCIPKVEQLKNRSTLFSDTSPPVDCTSNHNVSDPCSSSKTIQNLPGFMPFTFDTKSKNSWNTPDVQCDYSGLASVSASSRTEISTNIQNEGATGLSKCKLLKRTVVGNSVSQGGPINKKVMKTDMPSKSDKSLTKEIGSNIRADKRQAAKKYLQAIGSGWKKDRSGNWVKDEDAEFDSDEEAPDIP